MLHFISRISLTLVAPLLLGDVGQLLAKTIEVPQSFESIQEALNVALPGDTVEVDDGIYVETLTIDVANVSLRASGAVVSAAYDGPCVEVLANGVRVEGFRLINGKIGISVLADDVTIVENRLESIEETGIFVFGEDATVIDNELVSIGGPGIFCVASPNSVTRIEKNVIDLCRDVPIEAVGGSSKSSRTESN